MSRKAYTACRNCSGRRRNLFSGAFRSKIPFGSRLCQTENVQNSPSEKVRNMQKNPAEIGRFQPDLVGVSGFEPEASWPRRLVGFFPRLGHGLGQGREPAAQKLRRCKQRIGEDTYLLYSHEFRVLLSDLSHKAADSQAVLLFCSLP